MKIKSELLEAAGLGLESKGGGKDAAKPAGASEAELAAIKEEEDSSEHCSCFLKAFAPLC
jgi:hypothetical protein